MITVSRSHHRTNAGFQHHTSTPTHRIYTRSFVASYRNDPIRYRLRRTLTTNSSLADWSTQRLYDFPQDRTHDTPRRKCHVGYFRNFTGCERQLRPCILYHLPDFSRRPHSDFIGLVVISLGCTPSKYLRTSSVWAKYPSTLDKRRMRNVFPSSHSPFGPGSVMDCPGTLYRKDQDHHTRIPGHRTHTGFVAFSEHE